MRPLLGALAILMVFMTLQAGTRGAEATPLAPFIDLQEAGLTTVQEGEGIGDFTAGPVSLDVTVGGPVRFALLYWAGYDEPCTPTGSECSFVQPFKDQQVLFAGTPITGTVIGTETQVSTVSRVNVSYFADVTSLVSAAGPGPQSFTFADGNIASNLTELQGVTLFVAYTNPADPDFYRVLIWDNGDFADIDYVSPNPGNQTTTPVIFNHGAISGSRAAELYTVVGGGTTAGTDSTTISNNPTLTDTLDQSDGAAWDSDQNPVVIPANVGTTTVQVNSTPAGANADSLFWVMAALRVPLEATQVDVTKTGTPSVAAGANITYTITIENTGPDILTNVLVSDAIPAGTTLVSWTQTAGNISFVLQCVAGTCTASAPTLPVGETATFSLVVRVGPGATAGTVITNTATGGGTAGQAGPVSDAATATTTVSRTADVAVYKAISPVVPAPGSIATYRVRVRNLGPSTAENVVMTDDLPAGYEFIAFAANNPAGCNTPTNPDPVVICSRATMAPNSSVTWSFTARVPIAPDGRAKNTASVESTTGDSNPNNNTAVEQATLQ